MKFDNVGSIGLINDISPQDLSDGAFSNGQNVRFKDGYLEKMKGYSSVFGTPSIDPYWMLPIISGSTLYWVYCGLIKAYVTDGSTHTNITRQRATAITASSLANPTVITAVSHGITDQDTVVISGDTTATPTINGTHVATVLTSNTFTIPVNVTTAGTDGTVTNDIDYAATAAINWNGGFLSGIGIFNNGVDDPQVWTPATASTKLTSLKWDSGNDWAAKNHTAKVIRPFGNFLVALDITKSGTNYPYLVKWSHAADSGTEPVTWDETDTTKDAGETDLGKTGGVLIDGLSLRDSFIIYKEDATYAMRYIGGQFVFSFKEIFQFGALSRRCIKEFEGKHLVLSQGDLLLHDGQTANSIINKRMKNWVFNSIDSTNYATSFIVQNHQNNEFMVCFPTTGASLPNTALVWNYRDNTFGVRDLPNTPHIAYGVVDPSESTAWDDDSDSWDSDTSVWGQTNYNPTALENLMASGTNLFLLDDTDTANTATFTAYAERVSHDFGSDNIKFVKKIWPRMEASGEVTIKIGTQFARNDGVSWSTYTFNPNTETYVDVLNKGRYISFRVESTTDISWKLSEIDFEVQESGRY